LLFILSLIYGFITKINFYLYNIKFLKTYKVKTKVVSIGNIIVGGSGKTPLTIYICNLLNDKGYRVAVVGRGYGRNNSKNVILKQNQINLELSAEQIGDEMLEIYQNTNADVYIGKKKYEMVIIADEVNPKYDFIIIDDGFQHFKIKKYIEIVILDDHTINEKFLLPKGRLRENFQSLNRADIIVTRNIKLNDISNLLNNHNLKLNSNISLYDINYEINHIINYSSLLSQNINDFVTYNNNINNKFSLITAIANPNRFLENIEKIGLEIQQSFKFRDHHNFKLNEIKSIIQNNDITVNFITTEKDFVKLKPLLIQLDNINNTNIIDRFYFVKLELIEINNNNKINLINQIINFNKN